MIITSVIFLTIVTGISGMTHMASVGRVAGKAMLYFLTFSTLALIVGMTVANLVQPGKGLNIDPATLKTDKITEYAEKAHDASIVDFLMNIPPPCKPTDKWRHFTSAVCCRSVWLITCFNW